MRRLLFAFLAIVIGSTTLLAQGTTGKLTGTVSGPDGLLPGAKVVATDNSTNKEYTAVSNEQGFYQFPQLEFGTYTIRVTAQGFKTLVGNEQKIDVGRDATFNAALEVGDVSAEVVVTAGVDVITANTPQVSSTISPQQIMSLPMLARSPLTLTLLQAGTSSNGATTINGMRTSMTNITRDGINIQDTFIRANATDFTPGRPSVDDTAEFTLTTTNQEADQGYGGAQIRLVTPRGTKDFHGALYAYNRNSGFAANSFFNNRTPNLSDGSQSPTAAKPSYRNRWQYGGKVSGPLPLPAFGEGGPKLWKDKAVFFFAYEKIKDPVSSASTRTILSPTAQAGAYRYTRGTTGGEINTTVNGASVTCAAWPQAPTGQPQPPPPTCQISNILAFAQNFMSLGGIPSSIDPTVQARLLAPRPTVSNFTGGDGLNTLGYRFLRRTDQERDQYSSRVDVDINDANSLLFIYNYNEETNLRADADTEAFDVIPNNLQSSKNKQFTSAYRRVFSENVVNEFRGGFFNTAVPFDSTNPLPAYWLTSTLLGSAENTFMDQGRFTESWNFQSNGDWIKGNHSFKFGGQLQFFKVDAYNDAGLIPTVTLGATTASNADNLTTTDFAPYGGIASAATANAMVAMFSGIVQQTAQSYNVLDISQGFVSQRALEPIRHAAHSLYFADRWQVRPDLTLSLGVRWELYPAMTIANGVALEPLIDNPDDPLPSLLRTNGSYVAVGANAGKENAYYKTQWDNFAPNLGFAWTPNFEKGIGRLLFGGRTVIRGGYSHAFGNDSIITSIRNASIGNAGLARTASTVANQNGRLTGSNFTLPSTPTFVQPPRSYLQNNTSAFGPFFGTVFGIDPNIEVTRVQQYSLGIQREFWGNTAFEVRYVGSKSSNMVRSVDYNQIDIRNNGFLADYNRARANFNLTGNAFCTAAQNAGCVPLQMFINTNTPGTGRLVVGTGGLALSTFNTALTNGTPADLALTYITTALGTTSPNNTINLNNHPNSQNPNAVPYVKLLANPASGVVNLLQNAGNYQYDSLQFEVRRRFSEGLYFQANYTFSKNLGDATQSNGSQSLVEPFLDNANPRLDYTRADFDQTHAFNFNGVYQLPFGNGKPFLNSSGWMDKVFGGWELSGIVSWNSGVPITFVDPRGTLNRAARSGRQTANTSLTYSQIDDLLGYYEAFNPATGTDRIYWIDPSIICSNGAASTVNQAPCAGQVFFNVPSGETGRMGRAVVNAPAFFNIDAALLKNVVIKEDMRVQFRLEAYNVLNHANFFPGASIQNISSTTFGQITSASAPRVLQLALRFEW